MDQRWEEGGEETKLKGKYLLEWQASDRVGGGGLLISFFLPSPGGQGSEQRHFSLTVRQRAGFSETGHHV